MSQFTKATDESYYISCNVASIVASGLSILSASLSAEDMTEDNSDATDFVLDGVEPVVTIFQREVRFLVQNGESAHKYLIKGLLTLTPGDPGQVVGFSLIMNVV